MNNTNEFLRDYMTVKQRAGALELHPVQTDTSWLNLILIVLLYMILSVGIMQLFPPEEDFADTGVGCIDNCLDSQFYK